MKWIGEKMGIRIVNGRQTASKSEKIYAEISECIHRGEDRLFLIVPEQFTLNAERNLIEKAGVEGLMNVDVLSLKRLAFRVYSEVGGLTRKKIDRHGRQMLLQKSINDQKNQLTVYKKSATKRGFLEHISQMISDFKQEDVKPEMLEDIQKEVADKTLLSAKLNDIQLIYQHFQTLLGEDRMDDDDEAVFLCQQIPKSSFLKGAKIWIYGFYTFSKHDFKILECLAHYVDTLTVTLTEDPDEAATDVMTFKIPKDTRETLYQIAGEFDLTYETVTLEKTINNQEIDFLEQNLFSYKPKRYPEIPQKCHFFQAKTPWEEVEYSASKLVALLRDGDFEPRDFVVLAPTAYTSMIKKIFTVYHIPFFLDEVTQITDNILIEALLTLLDAIQSRFYTYDLLAYCKYGFTGLSQEDVETLENYALRFGIKGTRWEKPFTKADDDDCLEALEALRNQLMQPILELSIVLKAKTNVEEKSRALITYFETIGVENKMDEIIQRLNDKDLFEEAGAYNQVWNVLMEVLDQMVVTMEPVAISLKEYIQILNSGLSTYDIGVIPKTQNVVNVTDLIRSRNSKMKVLMTFGLNEGVFPSEGKSIGLLSEKEREILREKTALNLVNNEDYHYLQENYALYCLFSSPTDHVYFSMANTDAEGNSLLPSPLVENLLTIFPKMPIEIGESKEIISSAKASLNGLIDYLKAPEDDLNWQIATQWYKTNPQYKPLYEACLKAVKYQGINDTLSSEQAQKLYYQEPFIMSTSISRLEKYGQCPFSHFVRYGLRPKERRDYKVDPVDIGNVMHELLDHLFKEIQQSGRQLATFTDAELQMMITKILHHILPDVREGVFDYEGATRYLIRKIRRMGFKTAKMAAKHLENGDFKFKESEKQFVDQLTFKEGKVQIQGKIDRIDLYTVNNKEYVKIIDYKTSNHRLDLSEIYYGISLQLLVYLEETLYLYKDAIPGGAFYFHVDDPMLKVDHMDKQTITDTLNQHFTMKGVYLDNDAVKEAIQKDKEFKIISSRDNKWSLDEFDTVLDFVKQRIRGMLEEIIHGKISVEPYQLKGKTGCDYCPYQDICQFDKRLPGKNYVYLKQIKRKDEFMETIKDKGGDHELDE